MFFIFSVINYCLFEAEWVLPNAWGLARGWIVRGEIALFFQKLSQDIVRERRKALSGILFVLLCSVLNALGKGQVSDRPKPLRFFGFPLCHAHSVRTVR